MKIWLINHYAVPPQYYPLPRPSMFAKKLIEMGHEVTIIAASTVHNSDENLITDGAPVKKESVEGVPYVYIRCSAYRGNGIGRVRNILEFAARLPGVCDTLERPDAVVATSFDPISCFQGIRYAKKRGIRAIAEIADLWPETLLSLADIGERHPVVLALRALEKKIYRKADAIVFTMEGAYDYIRERGWEREVPAEKVFLINNGVDLAQFDHNRETWQIDDPDLNDPDLFKVVYTGSIRKVNNLGLVLDAAVLTKDPRVRFLIWGRGDELESLQKRVESEGIENVRFKGAVEKKYIPYITSRADLNLMHGAADSILRFGLSANKLFDYLAAGKPILSAFSCPYNPACMYRAGEQTEDQSPAAIAAAVDAFAAMSAEERMRYGENARRAAEKYDFTVLTKKLLRVLEGDRSDNTREITP